jgi:glycosyltransferase involved in cell wall biosynthesis
MSTLAGIVPVRNGFRLDYCWEEAARSLLAFCDEVVICDCESDDGTKQAIDKWASEDSRITPVTFLWTDPRGDISWWPTFLNYARHHAKSDWVIQLDADEILHEDSHAEVRQAVENKTPLICQRYNFWRDAQHLIPHGHCCGYEVVRVGPQPWFLPSDYPDIRASQIVSAAKPSTVKIMHYGFLRRREAVFAKMREIQRIWLNGYDSRLEAAEAEGGNWMADQRVAEWVKDLLPFNGTHPEIIKPWLLERGYQI